VAVGSTELCGLLALFSSLMSLNSHKECLFVVFWGQIEISRAFLWRIEFRNKGEDSLIRVGGHLVVSLVGCLVVCLVVVLAC
jgi:hypothetical protein